MQMRVIIVHGWAGTPRQCWFPWLKTELENKGYRVEVPQLPNPLLPKIKEWVPFLSKVVGKINDQTYFVGHSTGCQAILRLLEKSKTKAGGAVLVAPFFKMEGIPREVVKEWVETPLNFLKIKANLPRATAIFSDDDPLVPLCNKEIISSKLGSKIVVLENQRHCEKTKTLPVALFELEKIIRENEIENLSTELLGDLPTLDLHGSKIGAVENLLDQFLFCNKNKINVRLIFGIGEGKMRAAVLKFLASHPMVDKVVDMGGSCVVKLFTK